MEKGFYSLTSAMLTQSRKLNTISNNMGNSSTPGFKSDRVTSTTFKDQMICRIGNMEDGKRTPIGTASTIRVVDGTVTDFTQGSLSETGRNLDMMLSGDGFFAVQTDKGVVYTRNGSFTLDDEGYLCSPDRGRVLGDKGPILLKTDKITVDAQGNIFTQDGRGMGRIKTVQFADNTKLVKVQEGVYKPTEQAQIKPIATNLLVEQKVLEDSNVDMMNEMTDMMSSQRALQSSSQLIKMYDQLMGKIVSEIGRV
ncbi:MAG: flagellar hook-basal body protein [Oscillospiraceae bacterium]